MSSISCGLPALDKVLACCQDDSLEYLSLKELSKAQKDNKTELVKATVSYLDQQAGEVVSCCAVVFHQLTLRKKDSADRENIRIFHCRAEGLTPFDTSTSDKGIADFYFLDGKSKKIIHIQLDPNSKDILNIPANNIDINIDTLMQMQHKLWNGCVIVPERLDFTAIPLTLPRVCLRADSSRSLGISTTGSVEGKT